MEGRRKRRRKNSRQEIRLGRKEGRKLGKELGRKEEREEDRVSIREHWQVLRAEITCRNYIILSAGIMNGIIVRV